MLKNKFQESFTAKMKYNVVKFNTVRNFSYRENIIYLKCIQNFKFLKCKTLTP